MITLFEGTFDEGRDKLILKDEVFDAMENEEEHHKNSHVLDPGPLNELPKAWPVPRKC